MAFTAKDVQALREKTGAGMMDCKKALVEADGDMDKAVDVLRERGLALATKKASRIAAEGVVLAYNDEEKNIGVLVEVNSETDFVAKNDKFQQLVLDVAKTIVIENPADVDALVNLKLNGTEETVAEAFQNAVLSIGENMKIRRFVRHEGVVSTYIHAGGSVGVMVTFDCADDSYKTDAFKAMGKDVAMQVAAMNPQFLEGAVVPAEVIEHEKGIMIAQMKEDPKMANKPEKVMEGIIAGKINKFFKEVCLLDQAFVKDDSVNVRTYIANTAKELGGSFTATGFYRFAKGEGLAKREDNFADEVASMMK